LTINPAYAGTRGAPVVSGVFRKQWLQIEGAPTTSTISYHTPVRRYNFGAGANLIYDNLGPVTQTGLYLDYSYLLNMVGGKTLSFGLLGGFNHFYLNYTKLIYNEPDEDLAGLDNESLFLPNFGVGAYYYTENFYLGFSIPKLLRNTLEKTIVKIDHLNKEEWHWFLMGGAIIKLNPNIEFKPSFMTRVVTGAPISLDLTGVFMFYDKFWVGAAYRYGESVGGLFRWQFNPRFEIGYSYDYPTSHLSSFKNGTHEILLNYTFVKEGKRILSPRYF
jgi:type IX secretion system PorP/SprF family membrane protein